MSEDETSFYFGAHGSEKECEALVELSLGTYLLPFVSPFVYVACLGC